MPLPGPKRASALPEPHALRSRLSKEAEADLEELLAWSEAQFGQGAAMRYAELIAQALQDLASDPFRPNARNLSALQPSLFSYHLAQSRNRVPGARVRTPRHFILYRALDQTLDVVRILHDSRDIARHLSAES